ncbi:hypothetical protein DKT69_34830 [Micromonospora sicca]|uniref:TniQ domain-containing protein n=1 Tax=Micromonospora sicca TaxID=2202420 RepID=A0A317D0U9_9ACTN|nr:TniQ family protein [Micromonospora sp. 4G51]PWR07436.1 hypothetical protein DKT69_34830 [Micromonospora sp. 4G51]
MIPATADWGQPRLRRLPRRIAPVHDETLESYIGRLATRNYLSRVDLAAHLTPRRQGSRRGVIASESLAAVTGFAEPRLAYALPEIRQRVPYRYAPPMIGQVVGSYPNRRHPSCRRCAGATGPVTIWARCDYNVCVRHQLWLGDGVSQPRDQVDVADMPEIVQAQVRLRRLIRRRGYPRVRFYFSDACEIEHWGSRNPFALTPRNERMRRLHAREHAEFLPLSYGYAAQYPEVVDLVRDLLSVLASHGHVERDRGPLPLLRRDPQGKSTAPLQVQPRWTRLMDQPRATPNRARRPRRRADPAPAVPQHRRSAATVRPRSRCTSPSARSASMTTMTAIAPPPGTGPWTLELRPK